MWDWLAKGAKKAMELGAEYLQNAALVERLLALPVEEASAQLRAAVAAMDERAYKGFSLSLLGLIASQQQNIVQLQTSAGLLGRAASAATQGKLTRLQALKALAEQFRQGATALPPAVQAAAPPPPNASLNEMTTALRDKLVDLAQKGKGLTHGDALEHLKAEFATHKHKFEDARAAGLEGLLERLSTVVKASDDPNQTLQQKMAGLSKVQDFMAEMLPRVKKPTTDLPEPPTASRAGRVLASLRELKGVLAMEGIRANKTDGETRENMELFDRMGGAMYAVMDMCSDEEKLVRVEADLLRSLVNDVRVYARRNHVMLANPVWSHGTTRPDPNAIFCAGPAGTRALLADTARRLHLELPPGARPGTDVAEARWRDLKAASLAVFDISERAPDVFYELGIALALGTELLVLARAGTTIPFDVAQNMRFYESDAVLADSLDNWLTEALYGLQVSGAREASIAKTLAFVEQLQATDAGLKRVALQQLHEAANDPIQFRHVLQSLRNNLGTQGLDLLLPRWPGDYPASDEPRCFVVMPFRDELEAGYQAVVDCCAGAGVTPERGDVAEDQEIIQSIWLEICRATRVTVDLTGFNPNVCLELGIADTLGRPALLMGQPGTEKQLFPAIAKRRCHVYTGDATKDRRFRDALVRFLGATAKSPSTRPASKAPPTPPPSEPAPSRQPSAPAIPAKTIGGLWSGVLSDAQQQIDVAYRITADGHPMFGYNDSRGYHEDVLTHPGQRIQYVPPGGGVVTVDVEEILANGQQSGYVASWSFERAAHGVMDQDYSRITQQCELRGDKLAVVYAQAGRNYVSGSGMMVGGENVKRYEGLLERSGE